ncbi:CinA family protein [Nocardioides sp. MH1]|uniref:CinA family protein n=1 Tax=Nocardioides sp. MH1 TaxID=3242490 RepID=UPI003522BB5D
MTAPEDIVARLTEVEETVAAAESITGGRLSARLTDGPGSSKVFLGGVVSYATEVKVKVLGVPQSVIDEHGVISGACAAAMAEGVRELLGSTYGVSTTGVAGPDTQEGQPVGTVFVGVAGPAGTEVEELSLDGDRTEIQMATVGEAMSALGAMMDVVEGR